MNKHYTKLDEFKSENDILKTKVKKLEQELEYMKHMNNELNNINLELIKKLELYEKERNNGK